MIGVGLSRGLADLLDLSLYLAAMKLQHYVLRVSLKEISPQYLGCLLHCSEGMNFRRSLI